MGGRERDKESNYKLKFQNENKLIEKFRRVFREVWGVLGQFYHTTVGDFKLGDS